MENIIYIELLRRGYNVTVGADLGKEVDFIGSKANQRIYVQVAYHILSDKTKEREFAILSQIPDNFPKYVVTMDELTQNVQGIEHINIVDFLLSEDNKL